ncbi:hypothetical protein DKX38_029358 [Salix brachista]|uniref:inositol-1,3,4-trisphosphate 5/6-kinase n=1 Tax=Salix brachista TaxID=2182728 RepID=A0A5N5J2G1_9ROSI|nr:hypothetical protein DKX38_029358 [Salix brachista]
MSQLRHFSSLNSDALIIDPLDSIQGIHNRISMLQVVKIKVPLIAKPLMADGSETSHKMYLVFDKEGIDKLETRVIIMQEFVNHGGVIFKVYVVGDFVKCVKRKSLPDIKEDKLVSLKENSSSRLVDLVSRNKRLTLDVFNKVLCRLKELNDKDASLLGFEDELWTHFCRLPTQYAMDVNAERAEDVIMHKRLLQLAHNPDTRPKLISITPSTKIIPVT